MAKVLVIDDDAMNLRMAVRILKMEELDTAIAKSGAEGIAYLKENEVDLVLLDIEMPQMNGYETLENIRQDDSIASTKVMFLTGTVEEDTIKKAEELKALGCIKKPFVPQTFLEEIKKVI